jgi:hypothetical protein
MLHPRINGVICVSIPVMLSKKILDLTLLFNMVHTLSAQLYGTVESKRLKNKWSFMDMKNLKKVTITLCSLIAFISPLTNADVTTPNTFRIECESINYNEEVCQLPNIGIIDVKHKKTYSDWSFRENISWLNSSSAIYVNKGCRAKFEVKSYKPITIQDYKCSSQSNGFTSCPIPGYSYFNSRPV